MRILHFVSAALLAITTGVAFAQEDIVKTAKAASESRQDCIIHVKATVKTEASGMGMMVGQAKESKVEAVGTVVDPSGLTVVSLCKVDPTSLLGSITVNVGGEQKEIEMTSQFSDVKMRLADGTEVPAKLVLKEPDLDLAFVMPEKSDDGRKYNYINLAEAGAADLLEEVFTLDRFGKILNFKPAVGRTHITGVIAKPRLIYAIKDASNVGIPAFSASGKLVGLCTIKSSKEKEGGARAVAMVIIPAADVLDVTKQALSKKDEKKEDAPKDAETKDSDKKDGAGK